MWRRNHFIFSHTVAISLLLPKTVFQKAWKNDKKTYKFKDLDFLEEDNLQINSFKFYLVVFHGNLFYAKVRYFTYEQRSVNSDWLKLSRQASRHNTFLTAKNCQTAVFCLDVCWSRHENISRTFESFLSLINEGESLNDGKKHL